LIEHYLYLVPITRRRQTKSAPARFDDELISAGTYGLIRAVDRFDRRGSVQFTSFAIHWIGGAMLEWLRQDDWVPRAERLREKRGEPVPLYEWVSLEEILCREEEGTERPFHRRFQIPDPADGPETLAVERLHQESLVALLDELPGRERAILWLTYWEEEGGKTIGRRLGIAESTVSLCRRRSLETLRERLLEREWLAEVGG
jgi:RNA polymerase sigma factor for flagellar operon FliA